METILLLAHTESDGSLGQPAREALNTATALGGTLVAGLIGEMVQPAANQIATCGATRFLGVSGADFAVSRYASDAAAAEALVQAAQATIVIAAGTSRFARCLPGVAQRLGGRADTHVTGVSTDGGNRQTAIPCAAPLSPAQGWHALPVRENESPGPPLETE